MKTVFIFISILCSSQYMASQQPKRYTTQQLKQDFQIFKTALKEAHPGLYRFTAQTYFAKQFQVIESKLNRSMTDEAFYRLLNPVVAKIGCGHTKFYFSNRPDDWYVFHNKNLFPVKLYFKGGKAFVLQSFTGDTTLKPASEVLSINGEKTSNVIAALFKNIMADGHVVSAKYEALNQYFEGFYATFIAAPPVFRIGYKDAVTRKNVVVLLSAATQSDVTKTAVAQIDSFPFQLSDLAPGIGLLRISVFMPQDNAANYEYFLKTSFREINEKGIQNLIIDVRNNEGGTDRWGKLLYSYLSQKPFRYYEQLRVVQTKPFSFLPYAAPLAEFNQQYKPHLKKRGTGYKFIHHENLGLQQPQPDSYRGQVFILQNGRSFSVTSEFGAIVKTNHRALFFGDESGGAISGNNSGTFAIVTLPNTHLTIGIPLIGYYMHLKNKEALDRGVLPDYSVVPSVEDVLEKHDVLMEAVLHWIVKHDRIK